MNARSETEFLEQQAQQGRLACRRRTQQLGRQLDETFQLSQQTRRHPWMTTGAAAASGMLLGWLVGRRPRPRPRRRWTAPRSDAGNGQHPLADTILSSLRQPLFELAQTAVTALIAIFARTNTAAAAKAPATDHPTPSQPPDSPAPPRET